MPARPSAPATTRRRPARLPCIDRLMRARRFRRPLDLGTGSGVLAIAMAKVLRRPIVATDIDPVAVAVAKENARLNSVAGLVRAVRGAGRRIRRDPRRRALRSRRRQHPRRAAPPSGAAPHAARREWRHARAFRPSPGSAGARRRRLSGAGNAPRPRPHLRRLVGAGAAQALSLAKPRGMRAPPVLRSAGMFQSFEETADPSKGAERAASAPRQAEGDGARRLHRAARRRASGRIRAEIGGAARLADRLHRLGRHGGGARRQGGDLRRRPLHAAGARAGRHGRVRAGRGHGDSGRRRG